MGTKWTEAQVASALMLNKVTKILALIEDHLDVLDHVALDNKEGAARIFDATAIELREAQRLLDVLVERPEVAHPAMSVLGDRVTGLSNSIAALATKWERS